MFKDKIKVSISRRPVWISIFVLVVIIVIFTFSSLILYNHTVNLLTENLRERLLSISITAAASIDYKDIDALRVEEDWKKPEWAKVVNILYRSKYSNKNIVYMYIFRKVSGQDFKMEFVSDAGSINPYANIENNPGGEKILASSCPKCVDANDDGWIEPDGPDYLQWPGQPNDDTDVIPEAHEAYDRPITTKDIYTDEYGSVLTGYAPIKDDNGNTVAVLATDIKANDFLTTTRQTLYPFLVFTLFLVSVIVIVNILLIRSIKKEVKQRESIEELNKEITRAYAVEKKAKEEIQKLDKFKDQFVMTVQHNLRTPLTSMMGYLDLIRNGMFGKQNKKTVEVIQKFQTLTQSMIRMVNNFLDMAQFQLGKGVITLKPDVDMILMIDEIMGELSFKAYSKKVDLKFGKPSENCVIVADKEKLKAAVFNIIDNAVKYTEKGGVNITIEKHTSSIKIIVKDTGIGIAKEKLPTIFTEIFERSEGAKKASSLGSGVGLYLSGEIIKAHNGKAWAESEGIGKGSQFYVELPIINNTNTTDKKQ